MLWMVIRNKCKLIPFIDSVNQQLPQLFNLFDQILSGKSCNEFLVLWYFDGDYFHFLSCGALQKWDFNLKQLVESMSSVNH